QVTLTAAPDSGFGFAGWSGACTGTSTTCTVSGGGINSVTATFSASSQSVNHIIIMAQENRGFDHYFGALRGYWKKNGITDQDFDGLAQFNPTPGPAPTNPGCDPAFPFNPPPAQFNNCVIDSNSPPISSFHMISQCIENPSPSWNESHSDWNVSDPVSGTPTMDGFVHTAGHDARNEYPSLTDTDGIRAMSYYDDSDLPYYYFMASTFGTSD